MYKCPHCGESIDVDVANTRGKFNEETFIGVDWSKSSRQIAEELKIKVEKVYYARFLFSTNTVNSRHKMKYAWENVDWTRNDKVIAGEQKRSVQTVRVKRKKYAPHTVLPKIPKPPKPPKPKPPNAWDAVDWELSDSAIARMLGCTRQRVWGKRNGKR